MKISGFCAGISFIPLGVLGVKVHLTYGLLPFVLCELHLLQLLLLIASASAAALTCDHAYTVQSIISMSRSSPACKASYFHNVRVRTRTHTDTHTHTHTHTQLKSFISICVSELWLLGNMKDTPVLTLYCPSATLVTLNLLGQEHLETWW